MDKFMAMTKKDVSISICRVIAMLMILLCHIIKYYTFIPGHNILGSVFDSAVYTFIGISGYLYGQKTIEKFGKWFCKKLLEIALPASALALVVLVVKTILGGVEDKMNIATYIIYMLNLRGISFVFPFNFVNYQEVPVLGPLWFVAVILLCYLLLPILQKINKEKVGFLWLISSWLATLVLKYFTGINVAYFLTFAICYMLAKKETLSKIKRSSYFIFSTIMVALQVGRIFLNKMSDGTDLYMTYVTLSQSILGIWVFVSVLLLFKKIALAENKIFRLVFAIDGISFYIYLVQGCFFRGRLNAFEITDNLLLSTILFFGFTIISAIILKGSTKWVTKI